jgi:uncharacterized protein with PQ loop repeat
MGVFGLDIIAGALVAFAAFPKILQRLRSQRSDGVKPVDYGDLQRDILIIFGNIIWVFFGFREEIYGLVIFGSINVFFTSLLIIQSFVGQLSYRHTE